MADASRFPRLDVPFAIAGAAAGWLSAGLCQLPMRYGLDGRFRAIAAGVAFVLAGITGALVRRLCIGRRYAYEIEAPDPDTRPGTDSLFIHIVTVLIAGALAGAAVMALWKEPSRMLVSALVAMLCTVPFLPVFVTVLSMARRAQRGRLGSLVAGADRRAVWGILAMTMLVASLEGLPDWVAPRSNWPGPEPVAGFLAALVACIGGILVADMGAYRRARRVSSPALVRHDEADPTVDAADAKRLDLGLGNDIHAEVHRGTAAYRSRDRALALVQGDLNVALSALRGALWRGGVGLALAVAVGALHFTATTYWGHRGYAEARCTFGIAESCNDAVREAMWAGDTSHLGALERLLKGCDEWDGRSCLSIADLYRTNQGTASDPATVAFFEYRAAQRGVCPEGQTLRWVGENRCMRADDPRE